MRIIHALAVCSAPVIFDQKDGDQTKMPGAGGNRMQWLSYNLTGAGLIKFRDEN